MRKVLGVILIITAFVLFSDGYKLLSNDVPSVFQLAISFILAGLSAVGAAVVMFREK